MSEIEKRYKEHAAMEGTFRIIPSEVEGKFNIERADLGVFIGVGSYIRWDRMCAVCQLDICPAPLVTYSDALSLKGLHLSIVALSLQEEIKNGAPESIWCPEALSADHLFIEQFDSIEQAKAAIADQMAFDDKARAAMREQAKREEMAVYVKRP